MNVTTNVPTTSPIADMLVGPGTRVEAVQGLVSARAQRKREAHGRDLADSEIVDAVLRAARCAVVAEERSIRPEPRTVKQKLDQLMSELDDMRRELDESRPQGPSRTNTHRELSIAITALEEAQMRVARALAIDQGRFAPADLQDVAAAPAAVGRDAPEAQDERGDRHQQGDQKAVRHGGDEQVHQHGDDKREHDGDHGPEATRAGGVPNA